MNKKLMLALAVALTMTASTYARPHHGGPRGGGPARVHYRPAPRHVSHHGHHGSFWGRGGRNFWPGFVGGVVGGIVYDAVTTPTTVVTTPAVVTTPVTTVQNVWVEGRYVDQVLSNGTVVRVWQPGHYEQRTVVVQ